MSQDKKKDSNVIGIGHNQSPNTYSQEQYDKLVNGLHWCLEFAKGQVRSISNKQDDAFTGYRNGNTWDKDSKLAVHQKHERRIEAMNDLSKFRKFCSTKIKAVEQLAKENNVVLQKDYDDCKSDQECDEVTDHNRKVAMNNQFIGGYDD